MIKKYLTKLKHLFSKPIAIIFILLAIQSCNRSNDINPEDFEVSECKRNSVHNGTYNLEFKFRNEVQSLTISKEQKVIYFILYPDIQDGPVKGHMKFKKITNIIYKKHSNTKGILSVNYDGKSLNFGMIPRMCWEELVSEYKESIALKSK